MKELTLFFCHFGRIILERQEKPALQPGNSTEFVYPFYRKKNSVGSKDFHEKNMVYNDFSRFLLFNKSRFAFINNTTLLSKLL